MIHIALAIVLAYLIIINLEAIILISISLLIGAIILGICIAIIAMFTTYPEMLIYPIVAVIWVLWYKQKNKHLEQSNE